MVDTSLPVFPTTFIGRDAEIAELSQLFSNPNCRLLSLVGPGGIGKTRLAVEFARQTKFGDGIYFVPLQPLSSSVNIMTAIIDVLPVQLIGNVEPRQHLLDYLRKKHLLLLLDNFEHLLDGAHLVTDILTTAPHVKVLTTSRERLNLQAEQVWPVAGLNVPKDGAETPDTYSAVQLFVERAQQAKPTFAFDANWDSVIRICRLVDGLPLALELAATWVRAMSCLAIADEIQRSIDMLTTRHRDTPERHRSMSVVLDHSWQLLTTEEQIVFPRLAVFCGGFTVEAAQQVARASLQMLASLIDKSLVRTDDEGRYDLQEVVRQYAETCLQAVGDESVSEAYRHYYAAFMQRRVEDLKGRRQLDAIAEIHADYENVRTVWYWAARHKDDKITAQMIDGLWIYCHACNREHEAAALFRYAEQCYAPARNEETQHLWGRLLARAAAMNDSRTQLETALQIAQRVNDLAETAFCLMRIGRFAAENHDRDLAATLIDHGLEIYRQLGDRYALAEALRQRQVEVFYIEGTWERFWRYGEEALSINREIGNQVGTAWLLTIAALNSVRSGDFAEGERLYRQQITLAHDIGNQHMVADGLAHLAHKVYFIQGDFSQARTAAEEAYRMGMLSEEAPAIGWTLIALGLLACMDEDYLEGRRLCRQAASDGHIVAVARVAAWGLAIASCGLEDYDAAGHHLAIASDHLTTFFGQVGSIACLPIGAVILAHQGQPVRAVELLALAFTHPVEASGWMAKWPLLGRLRVALEQTLGETEYESVWARGTQLTLAAGLAALDDLVYNDLSNQSARQASANEALPIPLTPRELEVLALLAGGLTNPQIAERLFITIGTVKSHTNRIYSKLAADDRFHATQRAAELDLL